MESQVFYLSITVIGLVLTIAFLAFRMLSASSKHKEEMLGADENYKLMINLRDDLQIKCAELRTEKENLRKHLAEQINLTNKKIEELEAVKATLEERFEVLKEKHIEIEELKTRIENIHAGIQVMSDAYEEEIKAERFKECSETVFEILGAKKHNARSYKKEKTA